MTNLKTKEEIHDEYTNGIEVLELEIRKIEKDMRRMQMEIDSKNYRIEKLKEAAELYSPKKDFVFTVNTEKFVVEAFTRALEQLNKNLS